MFTILYGMANTEFIPRFLLGSELLRRRWSATGGYLFTEFALRPVAAQALEAGPPPRRLAPGIMGRTMTVWMLGSGVPVIGIAPDGDLPAVAAESHPDPVRGRAC